MTLETLVRNTRSFRRFDPATAIPESTLRDLVNLARLSASGGNLQPLRFLLSCTPDRNALIFPHLRWAALLKDWPGPAENERPTAYIVILCDTAIRPDPGCDQGIAAQSILLGATERGLGGCMIGSVDRPALHRALAVPESLAISLVLALGKPAEHVQLEEAVNGDVRYRRDAQGIHHVPKRPLDSIVVG